MHVSAVVTLAASMCLAGCSHAAVDGGGQHDAVTPPSLVAPLSHRGSLTASERSSATRLAKQQQGKVVGTFIGATAFATHGTPFDPGSACDVDKRFLNIRLVWKADANFTHSFPPGAPPDGPRKDLLMTVDPSNGQVCETGAGYRNVGAAPTETLLYGEWPDRQDG